MALGANALALRLSSRLWARNHVPVPPRSERAGEDGGCRAHAATRMGWGGMGRR
jgi:hypothetical protein